MKSIEDLMAKYKSLLDIAIQSDKEREKNIVNLIEYIDKNTNYYDSPASTKYHMSRKHGLLEHSISVAETMLRIKKSIAPELSNSSCVIVGLYHDLGKHCQYIENEPTEKQKKYGYPASTPYSYRKDIVYMPHAHRSIRIILPVFPLTDEEVQAILSHDGQYVEDNKTYAHNETKLALLLHMADYYSSRFLED